MPARALSHAPLPARAHSPPPRQELCASALFQQPDDLHSFLAEECGRLESFAGGAGVARLWTDSDLLSVHSLHDPTGRGVISAAQAVAALRNLGLHPADSAATAAAAAGGGGGASATAAASAAGGAGAAANAGADADAAGVTAQDFVSIARAAMRASADGER